MLSIHATCVRKIDRTDRMSSSTRCTTLSSSPSADGVSIVATYGHSCDSLPNNSIVANKWTRQLRRGCRRHIKSTRTSFRDAGSSKIPMPRSCSLAAAISQSSPGKESSPENAQAKFETKFQWRCKTCSGVIDIHQTVCWVSRT